MSSAPAGKYCIYRKQSLLLTVNMQRFIGSRDASTSFHLNQKIGFWIHASSTATEFSKIVLRTCIQCVYHVVIPPEWYKWNGFLLKLRGTHYPAQVLMTISRSARPAHYWSVDSKLCFHIRLTRCSANAKPIVELPVNCIEFLKRIFNISTCAMSY